MANQPMAVTTTGQPFTQRLCTRTMAIPDTNTRMPETATSIGPSPVSCTSLPIRSSFKSSMPPRAMNVGPIKAASIFEFAMESLPSSLAVTIRAANFGRPAR